MSTGVRWEHEVAEYLRSKGYHAKVRCDIGGHEIDVFATKAEEALIVECKDWNRPVSKDPVRTVHNNAMELGATPGLAYTSELTSGAADLAEDYGVLVFPAEVIRDECLRLEDVEKAVQSHLLCVSDASGLESLGDPLGPFEVLSDFPEEVAKQARMASFGMSSQDADALRRDIRRAVEEAEASQCVPVLRNDRGQLDLYFVGEQVHGALPRPIEKKSIPIL